MDKMEKESFDYLKNEVSSLENRIEEIKKYFLEHSFLMEKEIEGDFDLATHKYSNTKLRERFLERIEELKDIVKREEINPLFKLNININDKDNVPEKEVKIVFFAFAGNPPHFGHLMTAFDALIDLKADKVVFVSNGNDFRKPDLLSTDIRYSMISDVVELFHPFFDFGDIGKEPLFDENIPLIGEYTLFRLLKLNPDAKIIAYYLAGSDHLNRTVVKDGRIQNDTLGYLEENIQKRIFDFNSDNHKVVALFNARDKDEFEISLKKIDNPLIDIVRLNPSVSFSSTALRNALSGKGENDALFFLPYVNYKRIKELGLYKDF